WARVDSSFRRALDYDIQSELVVRSTMSGERRLKVRLGEAPAYQWEKDPHYYAASLVEFVVTAEDPFWYSAHEHDEFVFDGLNWYGAPSLYRIRVTCRRGLNGCSPHRLSSFCRTCLSGRM